MRKIDWAYTLVIFTLFSCAGVAYQDHPYVLDAPNLNLRGHNPDGTDDKPLSSCDPVPVPSSSPSAFHYPCVTHFLPDYAALLKDRDRLQKELIACQQGKP